jgi:hypothetical protein
MLTTSWTVLFMSSAQQEGEEERICARTRRRESRRTVKMSLCALDLQLYMLSCRYEYFFLIHFFMEKEQLAAFGSGKKIL